MIDKSYYKHAQYWADFPDFPVYSRSGLTLFGKILLTFGVLSFLFMIVCSIIPSTRNLLISYLPFITFCGVFILYLILKVILLIWEVDINWIADDTL